MTISEFTIKDLLNSLVSKASKDGIITDDEKKLINQIKIDTENIENDIKQAIAENQTRKVIERIFKNSSKRMIQNAISVARKDAKITMDEQEIIDELFKELGWDYEKWKTRNWFIFKICVIIEQDTDITDMLEAFDSVFCLRNMTSIQVQSGICLGTQHYVINENDVTLLAFALQEKNPYEWVKKGSFAELKFNNQNQFRNELRRIAQDLLIKYFKNIEINAN